MPSAPVTTMQRVVSSSASATARARPSRIAWSSALRLSGFEIVSRVTPSAGSSMRSLPGKPLLEDDEGVALGDGLTLLAEDLLHDACVLGLDRHLHLHRLEDDDRVALVDGVSHRALDLPDGAGDVRFHSGHRRNVAPVVARPGPRRVDSAPMILAIDQGTTGTTCLVFDAGGELAGRAYAEF